MEVPANVPEISGNENDLFAFNATQDDFSNVTDDYSQQ
jgi:hypothetical protein